VKSDSPVQIFNAGDFLEQLLGSKLSGNFDHSV
jgi:hypothetical protein